MADQTAMMKQALEDQGFFLVEGPKNAVGSLAESCGGMVMTWPNHRHSIIYSGTMTDEQKVAFDKQRDEYDGLQIRRATLLGLC